MDFSNVNSFDLIYLIPALWGIVRGFMNGIIKELALIAALCLGIYLAGQFADDLSALLKIKSSLGTILCFAIMFFITIILVFALSSLLNKLLEKIYLGPISKIAGALFGACKYLIMVGALMVILENGLGDYSIIDANKKTGSFFYEPVRKITLIILPGLRNS